MVLPERSPQNLLVVRRDYERIIEMYLRRCFRGRTPARGSELADLLGANRSAVSRLVRQLFGETLAEILRARRFAYAVHLLTTTPLTVVEVGRAAGFGDASTFFRAFRKEYGVTPAEYRANATKCN